MSAGCSRQHYRKKADREVYSILHQGTNDPRWNINDFHINPDPTSRMFNPFNPDGEPMPHDDPAAHRHMHRPGGMKGSRNWYEHGCTHHVENPRWRQFLLVNERGEIPLSKETAVELARLHAHEYQDQLEALYLSAMTVSQRQFRYDVQFFSGGRFRYSDGTRSDPTLSHAGNHPGIITAQRRFASGGEWVVGLANTVTWTLTGQSSWRANSLLNVGITQPLLRAANRKVELETLTQAERHFLRDVRNMALFQKGHYARIVTGTAPTVQGVTFGGGGGFYRLLQNQIEIQNQRQNVISLEGSLSRFSEMFTAGLLSNVAQVEQTRQSLLNSQRRLLDLINSNQNQIETYIRSLGLPPDLNVAISDPLLEQFQLTSPTLTTLTEDVGRITAELRQRELPMPDNLREETGNIIRRAQGEIVVLQHDLEMLQRSMPERIAGLQRLEAVLTQRIADGAILHSHAYDIEEFEKRVDILRTRDVPRTRSRLQATFTLLDLIANTEEEALREMIQSRSFDAPVQDALQSLGLSESAGIRQQDEYRDWVRRIYSVFQNELVSLSLMQTRTRLDAMTLVPVSVTPEEAFQVAEENRLDWMNQRSALVDAWRRIDIAADGLRGVLDLGVNGRLGSIDGRGGNVRVGSDHEIDVTLTWSTPLTRYTQMMEYRESQILYQRARRTYYRYVDSVQADLRRILREVETHQVNFEINRYAVLVGALRADIMQLQMEAPPQPGRGIDTTLSDQLIRALDDLMRSQNDLLNTWVSFQTDRMLLDFQMGTMELDDRGHWIDRGTMASATPAATPATRPVAPVAVPELSPQPIPVPILSIPPSNGESSNAVPVLEVPRISRRYVE